MTFQVREKLLYRGQVHQINCLPFASYRGPAEVPDFGIAASDCWRGYEGTWAVREDALFLDRIDPPHATTSRDVLREMFPDSPGPVLADWFSGELGPEPWRNPDQLFTLVFRAGLLLLEEFFDRAGSKLHSRLTDHAAGLFDKAEWGFLQAIQADRADLAAHLVYADWLEDHDEKRAHLVRAEAERLRQAPAAPQPTNLASWQAILPGGVVDPGDLHWFWCRLAAVRGE
jgi:uncharacterized protein (TIGR02996 family)